MTRMYSTPPKFSQMPSYIREDVPVYRLRGDIFVDNTLMLRGTTIETDSDYVPNEHMFPINDLALLAYEDFLAKCDKLGEKFEKMPLDKRNGYLQVLPKLPAFKKEWEKVNRMAKQRGIHICHAVDSAPSILGAPPEGPPKVRKVDMTSIPQMPFEDNTAIGK